MKLEEFMVELSIGVLSNLADGNEGSGVIENEDLNKLYLYTKQGLTRLYTHFPLVTKEETIAIHPNVREYPMTTPDLIKVLKASSNTLGIELPLQVGNVCEVNNINYFRLGTVPTESDAITLLVQVDHAPISKNNPTQTLVLPSILIEALQNYVAFRVYSNMNTAEARSIGADHKTLFDEQITAVTIEDLAMTSRVNAMNVFALRGWV